VVARDSAADGDAVDADDAANAAPSSMSSPSSKSHDDRDAYDSDMARRLPPQSAATSWLLLLLDGSAAAVGAHGCLVVVVEKSSCLGPPSLRRPRAGTGRDPAAGARNIAACLMSALPAAVWRDGFGAFGDFVVVVLTGVVMLRLTGVARGVDGVTCVRC